MLKLAADLKKRKTELLEKQLAQQKALLAKLENKSLGPEERKKIVITVKALQVAIDKTRAEALSAVERDVPATRAKEVVRITPELPCRAARTGWCGMGTSL